MKNRRVNPRTLILIAAIVCLAAVVVVLLIRFFPSFGSRTETTPNTTQQDSDTSPVTTGGSDATEGPQMSSQKIGSLTVSFADGELTRVDGETGLVTLLPDAARDLPRMDLQNLDGSLQDLSEEELQQLAVGLLQAYYVDAPAADTITVTADQTFLHAFLVEVPANGDTPALSAQVRFLEASNGLWYLVLLHASGEDAPNPLVTAYETAIAN